MSAADETTLDPFDEHFQREPRTGAGVLVVVFDTGRPERAERVASGLRSMIRSRKRGVETAIVSTRREEGLGSALERIAEEANQPLILVTTSIEPWTAAHLDPLLTAIDKCDHVYGRREVGFPQAVMRRLAWLKWRLLFAMPVLDVHSACRLHRREALRGVPLQSDSEFVDVELLAKATFLGHLIDEVPVPDLPTDAERRRALWSHDARDVFRHPTFKKRPKSGPSEHAEGQVEGDDGPDGHDGERNEEGGQAGAFEKDHAEAVAKLGEGQGGDERLHGVGVSAGGEEDAGEQPHGDHDEVHEAADGLGGFGPAGDQEADAGEGQRADDLDKDEK